MNRTFVVRAAIADSIDQRARQVAVVGAVVLGHGDGHAAEPVGPLDHLERRRVAVGHRHAAEVGIAEVEAEAEEHRRTVPLDQARRKCGSLQPDMAICVTCRT